MVHYFCEQQQKYGGKLKTQIYNVLPKVMDKYIAYMSNGVKRENFTIVIFKCTRKFTSNKKNKSVCILIT